MYICVDFDGTIVDHMYPEIGRPVPHAIEWLRKFNAQGADLILFTMRSDSRKHGKTLSQAVKYLDEHNIRLAGVNENKAQKSWTKSPKPFGDFYIDDSAVGCPLIHPEGFNRPCVDWQTVGAYIESAAVYK
ncbi:MAG: hypothetical protein KAG19_06595 [Methylococcales bacterium]|nr:hypothetical protein [Methylococcales bacterium]